jgi:hypothetical protein
LRVTILLTPALSPAGEREFSLIRIAVEALAVLIVGTWIAGVSLASR